MKGSLDRLPLTELPRERLEKLGAASLADYELLAILLRSGGPDVNALELSQTLLAEFDGLQNLLRADVNQLRRFRYMGDAKVSCLKAVNEIAKRSLNDAEVKKVRLETPKDVFKLIRPLIMGKDKEHLYLLSLDINNNLIKLSLVSIGTLTQTLADSREILKTALLKGASSIILAHNHPSEKTDPSDPDVQLTKEIAIACTHVGINFLDHIILTSTNFYSFKLSGLIGSSIRKEVEKKE